MAANIEKQLIEKLRGLPDDQQAEVLKFVESLASVEAKANNGHSGNQEHRSFLQVARSLRLKGPADWSSRLDDYLYRGAELNEQ